MPDNVIWCVRDRLVYICHPLLLLVRGRISNEKNTHGLVQNVRNVFQFFGSSDCPEGCPFWLRPVPRRPWSGRRPNKSGKHWDHGFGLWTGSVHVGCQKVSHCLCLPHALPSSVKIIVSQAQDAASLPEASVAGNLTSPLLGI